MQTHQYFFESSAVIAILESAASHGRPWRDTCKQSRPGYIRHTCNRKEHYAAQHPTHTAIGCGLLLLLRRTKMRRN